MHERDISKMAFTTPFGLYGYVRMPFGVCNGPATFQRLMQVTMSDLGLYFRRPGVHTPTPRRWGV